MIERGASGLEEIAKDEADLHRWRRHVPTSVLDATVRGGRDNKERVRDSGSVLVEQHAKIAQVSLGTVELRFTSHARVSLRAGLIE
jgi:hypothetical protein